MIINYQVHTANIFQGYAVGANSGVTRFAYFSGTK